MLVRVAHTIFNCMTPTALRQWRVDCGLTLDQAAALFGVSRRTFAYWEAGATRGGKDLAAIPTLAALAWCEVARRQKKAEKLQNLG